MDVIENFNLWDEWYKNRKIKVSAVGAQDLPKNSGVILKGDGATQYAIIQKNSIIPINDYHPMKISGKNQEQKIALHILQDIDIPLKIISGSAGSGKTLLACAHALNKLKNNKSGKKKIIIAKSMTPVGKDIGYLKGGMDDKVKPWLGPFYDNFIKCGVDREEMEEMISRNILEITPITYIQGRSISDATIIIDEVQNLDLSVIKQIVTRAADNSEIILLGDPTQKFEYRVRGSSLDELIERARDSELVGHVHLESR